MEIIIVGCGVSGLSVGVRLLEAGHRVAIVARDLPPHTTSNAAAAVWEPFEAYPADRVAAWGAVAYREFLTLANDSRTGILVSNVLEVLPEPQADPPWATYVEGFRPARTDELPSDASNGIVYRAPVIDTSRYLAYLVDRFRSLGGRIEQRTLATLNEAFTLYPTLFEPHDPGQSPLLVVNCSGLGARELAHDDGVAAARGQVARIEPSGFKNVLVRNIKGRPTYIIPRIDDIVLGGTFDIGAEDTTPDPATRTDILMRCAELALHADPRFAASIAALAGGDLARDFIARLGPEYADTPPAVLREEAVGLRPISPRVRVETETLAPDRIVVHNYGHGGAGITLSWGCAAEVISLIEAATA